MTHTDAPGFHVSRAAFDRVLRRSARAAGARFIDAVVRRVDGTDPFRVCCVTGGGEIETRRARYVLDCSGRAGVIARRGLRQVESRYRTIAIAFRVIGVSHLDLRPNMQPRRIEIAVYRGLEIIDREIVVSLFEEQQTEMVIDPSVGTIEL